jgi:hypothetical protein
MKYKKPEIKKVGNVLGPKGPLGSDSGCGMCKVFKK